MRIDTKQFLGEFETEARMHIEKIETAFLDITLLTNDQKLMDSVFRAAHSLKGTAGFLFLEKIVAVTHELENILSQIKEEVLVINDEITDIVLQCVDCLKELTDNIHNDEAICVKGIIETLKKYTNIKNNNFESSKDIHIPFNISGSVEKTLKNASKRGQKIYYINIGFNRSLGKYYKNPGEMIDNIFSVGSIVQAVAAGSIEAGFGAASSGEVNFGSKIINNNETADFTDQLVNTLKEHDTSTLEILLTSVLELPLLSIAIGVDERHISHFSKKIIFGDKNDEKTETTKSTADSKEGSAAFSVQSSSSAADDYITKTLTENGKNNKKNASNGNNILIRLDITDINKLMDLANEMILTRNQLFSVVSKHKKSISGLTPLLHDINHLTSEIHERIMFTRMQPISVIFNKFPRIIRDTAKAMNKDIEVNILRDDITLDKYLLEELTDPLTQIVKNSVDHGMETAKQRAASGKPLKGTITLNAYMRDGSAIIEITDDGGGIDIDAIKRKAVEQKIAEKETLALMSKNELLNLIFKPGITTAKQVTNLSGRGVGMDIVKTNIEKSGGSIEIESESGTGTTIRLKMPLTLSVINVLIVNIGSASYAIPELNVEHIVRICGNTGSIRLEKVNKSIVLVYNGRIIPVITMNEIRSKTKGLQPDSADTVLERCLSSGVTKCLVLKADGKNFALLIDNAIDTEQVIVKPLPVYLQNCPCYFSVTVLGSGKAVTILDAAGIMRYMGIEDIERDAAQQISLKAEKYRKTVNEKQILIFKCSGKEYFTVYMNDISRIEIIKAKDIQEINNESFINIAGITWRVLRPEDFTPVVKRNYTEEKLYMLTLKNSVCSIGLLVRNVIDKIDDEFILDNKHIYSDFIFGTSVYNEKILIFLNPGAIAEHTENIKAGRRTVRI